MALTIGIEGRGLIANADGSPDSAMSGSLWDELGAGTDTFSTDVYLYGNTSFAGQYSAKAGWQYYDIGAANVLDFTPVTGAEKDQFIWFWVSVFTMGKIATKANKGLTIRIGSSLTDYKEYVVGGSDDSNGWKGEWKCFVIDPTKANTTGAGAGSPNLASIRYMGFYIDNTASFLAPSIFMSQIAVGKGLRITGDSTTAWKDIITYCTAYPSRAWGMITEREGVAFVNGKVFIGNTTQGAATSFKGFGNILQWGKSEYWSGTAWVSSYPVTACGIEVQDNSSWPTTFEDGILVGTDSGRAGSQFIGNDLMQVSVDLYAGGHADSVTACYGTTFKKLTGTLNLGNDSDHKIFACNIVACNQFDPVGGPEIRNTVFAETADVDAALLWNENINIANCKFIANSLGAAIEMPSAIGTPYAYNALSFSGNTNDVLNSSGSPITINKNTGSDPTSYEGSEVTFSASYPLSIKVQNETKVAIQNAQTSIFLLDSPYTQLMNEDTLATGFAEDSYAGSTPVDIVYKVRKSETTDDPRYIPFSGTGKITSDGFSAIVTLKVNPFI